MEESKIDFSILNKIKPLLHDWHYAKEAKTCLSIIGIKSPKEVDDILDRYNKVNKEIVEHLTSFAPVEIQKIIKESDTAEVSCQYWGDDKDNVSLEIHTVNPFNYFRFNEFGDYLGEGYGKSYFYEFDK